MPVRWVLEALAPDLGAAEERVGPRRGQASSGSARHAATVSASQVSISLNSVQRWNGQPASRQIRTSDRLANTMSL